MERDIVQSSCDPHITGPQAINAGRFAFPRPPAPFPPQSVHSSRPRRREKIILLFFGTDPLCRGVVSDDTVNRWFKKFQQGNWSFKDDDWSEQPSTVDDLLKEAIAENSRPTLQHLSRRLNIPNMII